MSKSLQKYLSIIIIISLLASDAAYAAPDMGRDTLAPYTRQPVQRDGLARVSREGEALFNEALLAYLNSAICRYIALGISEDGMLEEINRGIKEKYEKFTSYIIESPSGYRIGALSQKNGVYILPVLKDGKPYLNYIFSGKDFDGGADRIIDTDTGRIFIKVSFSAMVMVFKVTNKISGRELALREGNRWWGLRHILRIHLNKKIGNEPQYKTKFPEGTTREEVISLIKKAALYGELMDEYSYAARGATQKPRKFYRYAMSEEDAAKMGRKYLVLVVEDGGPNAGNIITAFFKNEASVTAPELVIKPAPKDAIPPEMHAGPPAVKRTTLASPEALGIVLPAQVIRLDYNKFCAALEDSIKENGIGEATRELIRSLSSVDLNSRLSALSKIRAISGADERTEIREVLEVAIELLKEYRAEERDEFSNAVLSTYEEAVKIIDVKQKVRIGRAPAGAEKMFQNATPVRDPNGPNLTDPEALLGTKSKARKKRQNFVTAKRIITTVEEMRPRPVTFVFDVYRDHLIKGFPNHLFSVSVKRTDNGKLGTFSAPVLLLAAGIGKDVEVEVEVEIEGIDDQDVADKVLDWACRLIQCKEIFDKLDKHTGDDIQAAKNIFWKEADELNRLLMAKHAKTENATPASQASSHPIVPGIGPGKNMHHYPNEVPRAGTGPAQPAEIILDKGEYIVREGELSDKVYLLAEGTAEVSIREPGTGKMVCIATRGVGDYIGEIGPYLHIPRTADVRVTSSRAKFIKYTGEEFRAIVGDDKALDELVTSRLLETIHRQDLLFDPVSTPREESFNPDMFKDHMPEILEAIVHLKKGLKGNKVLIVGNAMLGLPAYLACLGMDVTFVDHMQDMVLIERSRYDAMKSIKKGMGEARFIEADIEDFADAEKPVADIEENSFDLILMFDLIGPISNFTGDADKFIDAAYRLAKDEAVIYLSNEPLPEKYKGGMTFDSYMADRVGQGNARLMKEKEARPIVTGYSYLSSRRPGHYENRPYMLRKAPAKPVVAVGEATSKSQKATGPQSTGTHLAFLAEELSKHTEKKFELLKGLDDKQGEIVRREALKILQEQIKPAPREDFAQHIKNYVIRLKILSIAGVLEGLAIYPLMGIDIFPAQFCRTIGINGKCDTDAMYDDITYVDASIYQNAGVDSNLIRRQLVYIVDNALNINNVASTADAVHTQNKGHRVLVLKGISWISGYARNAWLGEDPREIYDKYLMPLCKSLIKEGDHIVAFDRDIEYCKYLMESGEYEEIKLAIDDQRVMHPWLLDGPLPSRQPSCSDSRLAVDVFEAGCNFIVLKKKSGGEKSIARTAAALRVPGVGPDRMVHRYDDMDEVPRAGVGPAQPAAETTESPAGVVTRTRTVTAAGNMHLRPMAVINDVCMNYFGKELEAKGISCKVTIENLNRKGRNRANAISALEVGLISIKNGNELKVSVETTNMPGDAIAITDEIMDWICRFLSDETALSQKNTMAVDDKRRDYWNRAMELRDKILSLCPTSLETDVRLEETPESTGYDAIKDAAAKEAERFKDRIKLIGDAKREDENIYILFGTSCIRGYEQGKDQYKGMNPLLSRLRHYCGKHGVTFIDTQDANLLGMIEGIKKEDPDAKIMVLADNDTIKSYDSSPISEEEGIILGGIDNLDFGEMNFNRVVAMIDVMGRLYLERSKKDGEPETLIRALSLAYPELGILFITDRRIRFIPDSCPIDTREHLIGLYETQKSA